MEPEQTPGNHGAINVADARAPQRRPEKHGMSEEKEMRNTMHIETQAQDEARGAGRKAAWFATAGVPAAHASTGGLATMKCLFDSAATPTTGWLRNLSLSAALLLFLMLVAAPWHSAVGSADNPYDTQFFCTPNIDYCATDDGVRFSVDIAEAREGVDATLDFTVTVDNPRSESLSVDWRTVRKDGTHSAWEGDDYTASSGSLSIAPGRSIHTISIPIIDDSRYEETESLWLKLDLGPRGPELDPNDRYVRYFWFRGVIHSDDVWVPPSGDKMEFCQFGTCETRDGVTFLLEHLKGREGTDATLDFTVTVDNPRAETMTVGWQTDDYWSSAKAGEDYTAASGSLSVPPGRSSHTISIAIIDDELTQEVVESLALELDVGPRAPELHRDADHYRYFTYFGYILPSEDTTAPSVTVTHDPLTSQYDPWSVTGSFGHVSSRFAWLTVRVEIEFSEPVAGFDKSDLEFENGRVVVITENDGSYRRLWSVYIVPDEGFDGTMSIRVPAGVATDSAGLSNTASNTIMVPARRLPSSRNGEPDVVLSCARPSDPAVWATDPHYGHNYVEVDVKFHPDGFQTTGTNGSRYGPDGLPLFSMSSMSLTNVDGVQATYGLSVTAPPPPWWVCLRMEHAH